jgi:uncharacterized protein (DUF2147 family)
MPLRLLGPALLASLTAFASLFALPAAALDGDTPIGRWQTYDDQTNKPRGVVHIFEKDGKLFGQIERAADKKDPRDVCSVCTDERRDQPIDGLTIIRNMQRSADNPLEWAGGDILDPDTGRLYGLKLRVEDRGGKLLVRGFFGVSLLGRTQTWKRLL